MHIVDTLQPPDTHFVWNLYNNSLSTLIYIPFSLDNMENSLKINNWTESDRKVLFESLKGNVNRKKKSIHINEDLLERFEKLHPKKANNTHTGLTLSDAVNKGLLIYMKLYEDEGDQEEENREERYPHTPYDGY